MKKIINLFVLLTAFGVIWGGALYSDNGRQRISSMEDNYDDMTDLEAEIMFGRDLAARILGNYKAMNDPELTRYVNLVGKGIALYSGRPELEFRFIVLDTDEVNAFATPGGYIFLTRGALTAMDNEAQLACVLGHEIAHVTEKHVVRRLNIHGEDTSTFSAVTGAIGSSTATVRTLIEKSLDEAATILLEQGYKLKEEMEADSLGIQIAALAGYDPTQLGVFLNTCKGFEKPDASYKGEHPQLAVRQSSIRKTLTESGLEKTKNAQVRRRFHAQVKK